MRGGSRATGRARRPHGAGPTAGVSGRSFSGFCSVVDRPARRSYFGRRTVFARYLLISLARPRGSRSGKGYHRGAGRRESHFGGRHRTSCCYRVGRRCAGGGCAVLGRHGEVRCILISVLGHSGPCLYESCTRVAGRSFLQPCYELAYCVNERDIRTTGLGQPFGFGPGEQVCWQGGSGDGAALIFELAARAARAVGYSTSVPARVYRLCWHSAFSFPPVLYRLPSGSGSRGHLQEENTTGKGYASRCFRKLHAIFTPQSPFTFRTLHHHHGAQQ